MSLKDLQDAGVLLPEDEWGAHDTTSGVNRVALVGCWVALMYVGGGHALTFVGAALFLAFMGCVTYVSIRGAEVQSSRFEEEREALAREATVVAPAIASESDGSPEAQ